MIGRNTMGVRLMRVDEEAKLAAIEVEKPEEPAEAGENIAPEQKENSEQDKAGENSEPEQKTT